MARLSSQETCFQVANVEDDKDNEEENAIFNDDDDVCNSMAPRCWFLLQFSCCQKAIQDIKLESLFKTYFLKSFSVTSEHQFINGTPEGT